MSQKFPHSLEAERILIGAAMLRQDAIGRVASLPPSDFFNPDMGALWAKALEFAASGKAVDAFTLATAIGREDWIVRLTELTDHVPSVENITHYARIVAEKAALRRLILACASIMDDAQTETRESGTVIQDAADRILRCQSVRDEAKPIQKVLEEVYADAEARFNGELLFDSVPTGLRDLDEHLAFGGLPLGHVTILAGATSSGKSALANTVALHEALYGGVDGKKGSVCCGAFEDSAKAVVRRQISALTGISNSQIQRSIVGNSEWQPFTSAINELDATTVHFFERHDGVESMAAKMREHVRKHQTRLVIIDFLQLLNPSNKQDDVDRTYATIVQMAHDMPKTATLVVSQLKRTGDAAPTKQDLYHSGALEQWAHTIGLLWRPDLDEWPEMVALILDKQKDGRTGTIALGWDGNTVSYKDADPESAKKFIAAARKVRRK